MPVYVISTDQSGKLGGDDGNPPRRFGRRASPKNLGEFPPDLDLGGPSRLTGSPPFNKTFIARISLPDYTNHFIIPLRSIPGSIKSIPSGVWNRKNSILLKGSPKELPGKYRSGDDLVPCWPVSDFTAHCS
jgi:hypothetical protein